MNFLNTYFNDINIIIFKKELTQFIQFVKNKNLNSPLSIYKAIQERLIFFYNFKNIIIFCL